MFAMIAMHQLVRFVMHQCWTLKRIALVPIPTPQPRSEPEGASP
jgi:hypothetical protein